MSLDMHGIVPDLVQHAVPVHTISPMPGNPNEGDVGAMCVQLEARGQHRPVVVQRSTGLIIAGNHLWAAATALGWTHVAAIFVDDGDLEAQARMVGDNLPGRKSRDDPDRLADVLSRLKSGGMLEGSGYTDEDRQAVDEERAALAAPLDLGATKAGPDLTTNAEQASWPLLSVRVRPNVYEAWLAMVARDGRTESDVFADMVTEAMLAGVG